MSDGEITILGERILFSTESWPIDSLKYLKDNPRVFSCIGGEKIPTDSDELQKLIEKEMLQQPSVKNLLPSIEAHGGLAEPILIRFDTKQVIEGNSRLACFRKLYSTTKDEKWAKIQCKVVSKLTEEQQDAYLSLIHIKGKTPWEAYEKANFAYVRSKEKGLSDEEIALRTFETVSEIRKRIQVVDLMKKNNDKKKSHFSYYDVLVRTRGINELANYTPEIQRVLLAKNKKSGSRRFG